MLKKRTLVGLFAAATVAAGGGYMGLREYQGTGVNKAPIDVILFESWQRPVQILTFPRPLDLAVERRDLDTVRNLLEQGANPDLYTHFGGPALNGAADWVVDLEMMSLLIEYGADVNQPNRAGTTPLHKVISSLPDEQAEEAFRYLLSLGADPDLITENSHTPREWAEYFRRTDLLEIIEEYDRQKQAPSAHAPAP